MVHKPVDITCLDKSQPTMSAKSLGTSVACAIDELQKPLPRKTMLFERHMTITIGITDAFPNS